MRFLVGEHAGTSAVFAANDASAVNITSLDPAVGTDLASLIASGRTPAQLAELCADAPDVPVADITPALPVARPGKVLCLGLNYLDHVEEGGRDVPRYPTLFMRAATSLIPSGAAMVVPACSETLDYEVELMVIIGKGGRHISVDDALDHVFGYTTFNDGSVREYQRRSSQFTAGKNFDATGAVGPIVVTPDELPAGAKDLPIRLRIGDELMQDATTSDMMWPVAETIATIA